MNPLRWFWRRFIIPEHSETGMYPEEALYQSARPIYDAHAVLIILLTVDAMIQGVKQLPRKIIRKLTSKEEEQQ